MILYVLENVLMVEFLGLAFLIIASILNKKFLKITRIIAYIAFLTLLLYILLKILVTILS
ncbi:MAG: hypothetical protein B6U76_05715 [Desulfurococcales archaeon ex4484_217_2]|nr:MAG: hypothetical protein B6U76_05715 [Desulfurococcales archaeon ex4484_217_2]